MRTKSIVVSLQKQRLSVTEAGKVVAEYSVSTAVNGSGQQFGSECTPLGRHLIRACIGKDAPMGAVFVGRRWRGEIYSPELAQRYPARDWILTRILWLSGLEIGHNRLGGVDTMRRYIYIHGCPDESPMGIVGSHGCIRMHNRDVVSLFSQVGYGSLVDIHDA